MSVPCGLDPASGMPVGLQLVGRSFDEATLLRVGRALEREVGAPPPPALREGTDLGAPPPAPGRP
jgi:aspartyl-tRNA(Asn)/glutamyl-tRNA(Gln) amidotransferase subunit A